MAPHLRPSEAALREDVKAGGHWPTAVQVNQHAPQYDRGRQRRADQGWRGDAARRHGDSV